MKPAEASTDRFWRRAHVRGDGSDRFGVRDVSHSTPTVSSSSTRGLARLPVRWKTKVTTSEQAPPWTPGIAALMRNLARRGLLPEPQ